MSNNYLSSSRSNDLAERSLASHAAYESAVLKEEVSIAREWLKSRDDETYLHVSVQHAEGDYVSRTDLTIETA